MSYILTAMNLMSDMNTISEKNKEKVKYFYDLYFATKKRKDMSRGAKSRTMKYAEKEWRFWISIEEHFENILN